MKVRFDIFVSITNDNIIRGNRKDGYNLLIMTSVGWTFILDDYLQSSGQL